MENFNQVFTIPHTILLTPSYLLYQYSLYDNRFHNISQQNKFNKHKNIEGIMTSISLLYNGYSSDVYINENGMMTHESNKNCIPVHIINIQSRKVNVEIKNNDIINISMI